MNSEMLTSQISRRLWSTSVDEHQPEKTPIRSRRLEELESILELAEELRAKCEAASMRIERIRTMQLLTIMVLVIVGFTVAGIVESLGLSSPSKYIPLQAATLISLVFMFFVWTLLTEANIRRTIVRTAPDRRALSKLVRLMRETEQALTESQRWSTLDRARFHIQLSRFDIDYPYHEVSGGIFSVLLEGLRAMTRPKRFTISSLEEREDPIPKISSSSITFYGNPTVEVRKRRRRRLSEEAQEPPIP